MVTTQLHALEAEQPPSKDDDGADPLHREGVAEASVVPGNRAAITRRLLERAAQECDPVERKRLQDEVVVLNMGLARGVASRYRGRGIAEEDLAQAASMALLKAARNFDVSLGVEFVSYAVVTMKGEVKRQFRDYGWMVRPPRPVQKLQADVSHAQSELTHLLGRSPRVVEVAAHLDVAVEEVVAALTADGCFAPTSLDTPIGDDGRTVLGELLPDDDTALSEAENRVMLTPAVRSLPERERRIVYLRFFRQQTQTQIAAEIGMTQMQVSRVLARILDKLRGQLA